AGTSSGSWSPPASPARTAPPTRWTSTERGEHRLTSAREAPGPEPVVPNRFHGLPRQHKPGWRAGSRRRPSGVSFCEPPFRPLSEWWRLGCLWYGGLGRTRGGERLGVADVLQAGGCDPDEPVAVPHQGPLALMLQLVMTLA